MITVNNTPIFFEHRINSMLSFLEKIDGEKIPDFQIEFTNDNNWKCETIGSFGLIVIDSLVLEVLWRFSYSYYNYYNQVCIGEKPTGQTVYLSTKGIDKPIHILRYATHIFTKDEDVLKGIALNELPALHKNIDIDADSPDFLFEIVFAFYCIHEIGHIEAIKHHFESHIQEEEFCDLFSAELLSPNTQDQDLLKWRKRGIALGLTLVNVLGMHTKFYDGNNHPKAYDRIVSTLDRITNKDDDELWGWVVALFALHMTQNHIPQPTMEFDRFRDAIDEYKRILEQHETSTQDQ